MWSFQNVKNKSSIANAIVCPILKICGNYHVANVVIFSTSNVCCNAYYLKSKVLSH